MPASPINPSGIVPDAITIIIVTFQNAEHIAACLQSLIEAEPVRRVFLFLIDNASTDGTNEIIRHAILNLPKMRFHAEFIANAENFGFTRAVNQGMARHRAVCADRGGPVLFLNPDTILPPRSLAALLEKLYATPGAGVIAPQLVHEDGRIQTSCRRFPTQWDLFCELSGLSRLRPSSPRFNRWKMGDFDHRTAMEVDQPQGACLLARPEVVAQICPWDERFPIFFSDVDWCKRVREHGWKIRFEPSVQIIHVRGASVRQVRASAIWSSHVSFWQYLWKHENSWWEKSLNMILGPLLLVAAGARMVSYFISVLTAKARQKGNNFKKIALF